MYPLPPIVPEAFSHMETGSIGMYKLPPIQGSGQVGDIHFHLSLVVVTRVSFGYLFLIKVTSLFLRAKPVTLLASTSSRHLSYLFTDGWYDGTRSRPCCCFGETAGIYPGQAQGTSNTCWQYSSIYQWGKEPFITLSHLLAYSVLTGTVLWPSCIRRYSLLLRSNSLLIGKSD